MKRIFFFGTPDIAVPSLEMLAQMPDVQIVGVGVFPDKKVGRKQMLTPCPVKKKAQILQLPIFEIANKKELRAIFETQHFDMALVIAFGMIFPEDILSIPRLGVVNVHFSLLPRYRGASPVQSVILAGENISGITFQQMVYALDQGDILLQKSFDIAGLRTSEVFLDFSVKSAQELPLFLDKLFIQEVRPIPQEGSLATYCGKFEKSDGEIFPVRETAQQIYQKYLAFDLFPGIFLQTSKGALKILEASLAFTPNSVPLLCVWGTVLYISKGQMPGKNPSPILDIIRGNKEIGVEISTINKGSSLI